jgi:hypothetical protein
MNYYKLCYYYESLRHIYMSPQKITYLILLHLIET